MKELIFCLNEAVLKDIAFAINGRGIGQTRLKKKGKL